MAGVRRAGLIVRGGIIHRIAGQRVGESVVSTLTLSGMQLVWTKLHDQALEPGILNLIERVGVDDWCEGPVVGDNLEHCTGKVERKFLHRPDDS